MQYHVLLLERDSCTWYIDAGLCVVPPLTARALDPMCVWQLWHPTNAVYVLGLHLLTIQLILWPVSVCCMETMTSAYLSNLPLIPAHCKKFLVKITTIAGYCSFRVH